ncbi:hypothetical protein MMC25_005832 [Agyrium rufum]|nr:hypothetical protein [Agyrium rufum]
MSATTHVPAWKKLGLKLKNASVPEGQQNGVQGTDVKKRTHTIFEEVGEETKVPNGTTFVRPSKKAKRLNGDDRQLKIISNGSHAEDVKREPLSRPLESITASKKNKSVSFASDTKSLDGDEKDNLRKEWIESEGKDLPNHQQILTSSTQPPKKPTKGKKPATRTPTSTPTLQPAQAESELSPDSSNLPPYLRYLKDYYYHPANWKFNKARQTQLLKFTFDMDKIPSAWGLALQKHWTGTTSQSIRDRLSNTAKEIIAETSDLADVEFSSPPPSTSTPAASQNTASPSRSSEADGDSFFSPSHKTNFTGATTVQSAISTPENSNDETSTKAAETSRIRREANYKDALKRDKRKLLQVEYEREEVEKEKDVGWRKQSLKRKRALEILNSLAATPLPPSAPVIPTKAVVDASGGGEKEGDVKPPPPKKAKISDALKKKRKRKRRTGVPDDDSSSSDAWSSVSEDDSGIGLGPKKNTSALTKTKHRASSDDEGSSTGDNSSSSSSSSENDSDSQSGSESDGEDSISDGNGSRSSTSGSGSSSASQSGESDDAASGTDTGSSENSISDDEGSTKA